jgi:hypothetical protein
VPNAVEVEMVQRHQRLRDGQTGEKGILAAAEAAHGFHPISIPDFAGP